MNGCVAVTRTEHIEPNPIGHSGSKAELLTDETDFGCRSWRPQVAGLRRITRMTSSSLIVVEAVRIP
jgi:hypothetical protein